MDVKDKTEQMKFVIGRFDHYFDSVNNKGNVFLTLNTFLLGGLIAGYYTLQKDHSITTGACYLFATAALFNLTAIGLVIAAIIPYMNFNGKDEHASLINYNDIASYTKEELVAKINTQNELNVAEDLVHQKLLLSKGLRRKFNLMWYATAATAIELAAVFVLGIILFKI